MSTTTPRNGPVSGLAVGVTLTAAIILIIGGVLHAMEGVVGPATNEFYVATQKWCPDGARARRHQGERPLNGLTCRQQPGWYGPGVASEELHLDGCFEVAWAVPTAARSG